MSIIKKLDRMTLGGGSDIEGRVVEYTSRISKRKEEPLLYNLGNRTQFQVTVNQENIALLDIIYKDWTDGRWNDEETALAQIILSSTEPLILLNSAEIFPYRNGKLLDKTIDQFMQLPDPDKEEYIIAVLNEGIDQDHEIVVGGNLIEFDHNHQLDAFAFTCISYDNKLPANILNVGQLNGRTLLAGKDDFYEDENWNLIIMNGGVGSFMNSQLLSSISCTALQQFGWKLVVDNEIYAINTEGKRIIRFEIYSAVRNNISNDVHCMQPMLQRWIMDKDEYLKVEKTLYPYKYVRKSYAELSSSK